MTFEMRTVHWTPEFLFALAWLVIVLSFGAIWLLYFLISRSAATRVVSLFYLTPPVTALMAWALFNERLAVGALIGMVFWRDRRISGKLANRRQIAMCTVSRRAVGVAAWDLGGEFLVAMIRFAGQRWVPRDYRGEAGNRLSAGEDNFRLFIGCAAGDTAMGIFIEVADRRLEYSKNCVRRSSSRSALASEEGSPIAYYHGLATFFLRLAVRRLPRVRLVQNHGIKKVEFADPSLLSEGAHSVRVA